MEAKRIYRRQEPDESSPIRSERQAASMLGCTPKHLSNLRSQGKGPAYCRVNGTIRYLVEDIIAWIRAGRVQPEG